MNAGSAASCVQPLPADQAQQADRVVLGASHCSGSTQRNRSRVRSSHDQRRLHASSCSGARASGSRARTVKLRSAFISRNGSEIRGVGNTYPMGVIGRIVIDDVRPRTPTGLYPAKAVVGERVTVSAAIFKDGHDILAAQVR